jgi:hypothetical protein
MPLVVCPSHTMTKIVPLLVTDYCFLGDATWLSYYQETTTCWQCLHWWATLTITANFMQKSTMGRPTGISAATLSIDTSELGITEPVIHSVTVTYFKSHRETKPEDTSHSNSSKDPHEVNFGVPDDNSEHPDPDIALMMEAGSTSETSVNLYQTTSRNNPEDSHLHTCCHENLNQSQFNGVRNLPASEKGVLSWTRDWRVSSRSPVPRVIFDNND